MLSSTITTALVLLTASARALPWPGQPTVYSPSGDLSKLAKLFPQSALPAPDGQQLKYVLLGIGTQNYTCATSDDTTVPGTTGALGKPFHFAKMKVPLTYLQPLSTTSAPSSTMIGWLSGRSLPSPLSLSR